MNEIAAATSPADVAEVRRLFGEYSASVPVDLCLQHIDTEMASLPGVYAPPRGALFLARADGLPAGCIGLREFSAAVGEIKRCYVVPAFRGRGLGRGLVSAAMAAGRSIGYDALVLDTLATMTPAISLYLSFGFRRTEAYWANPHPGVEYFRVSLAPERTG